MVAEVRSTSLTGGQKGVKLSRFSLIPVGPLTELAVHYGRGAKKYDEHNFRRGYDWSKSYDAIMRHSASWNAGYDYDVCSNEPDGCLFEMDGKTWVGEPDTCWNHTGSHHMVAVAWHSFTLLEFRDTHPEYDDRYIPKGVTNGNNRISRMAEGRHLPVR